jgi:hypothetical protein
MPSLCFRFYCPTCKCTLSALASEGGMASHCGVCGQPLHVPRLPAAPEGLLHKPNWWEIWRWWWLQPPRDRVENSGETLVRLVVNIILTIFFVKLIGLISLGALIFLTEMMMQWFRH